MSGTYRKEGAAARVTSLRGKVFESTTRESGIAGYSGGRFFSASGEARHEVPASSLEDARLLYRTIATAAGERGHIERLRVVCGAATHSFAPEEEEPRSWSEGHAIVHVTLVAPSGARISVMRGGTSATQIDTAEIGAISSAVARAGRRPRIEGDAALSLSSSAAATLAAEIARHGELASHMPLVQETHPAWTFDGEGLPIARFIPQGQTATGWPNVFRPSYRSPAVVALMHVELNVSEESASAPDAIEVVELARAPHIDEEVIVLDALCSRDGERFFATFEIPLESLAGARAAGGARSWYPFHAGAWGRPTVIRGARER